MKIEHAELPNIAPVDVVNILNTGGEIVNATYPFIKDLFAKIKELVGTFQTDALSTPHGKRVAIEALQAQNLVQKELNKLNDKRFAELLAKGLISE